MLMGALQGRPFIGACGAMVTCLLLSSVSEAKVLSLRG